MKKIKRWIALLLAIVLVGSNAIYSMSSSLKANQINGIAEGDVVQDNPTATEADTQNVEGATVEVVDDAKPTEQPAADSQNDSAPEPVISEEPAAEQPIQEQPAQEAVKYNVVINQPDVDGGSIQAGPEEGKTQVGFDGNGQFRTEITEGALFSIDITANENYEVEKVTDQNGTEIAAERVNEKVYSYNIPNVTSDLSLFVNYKEIETAALTNGTNKLAAPAEPESTYYKVKFVDEAKEEIAVQDVKAGEAAVIPAYPEKEGYKFTGWKNLDTNADADLTNIQGDITVWPGYQKLNTYKISIRYILGGTAKGAVQITAPYTATVEEGQSFTEKVHHPTVKGFDVADGTTEYKFNLEAVMKDVTVDISYTGTEKSYTVEHQLQSADDDTKYITKDKETIVSAVGLMTEAQPKNYSGFTARPYANTELAGEGDTVTIVIQYDRNRHLVSYDTDGGSYVKPQYIRFGAAISVTEDKKPEKQGCTFAGWTLNNVDLTADATMPDNNIVVKAKWTEKASAGYTVIVWKEKMEGEGAYAYQEIEKVAAATDGSTNVGSSIEVSDNIYSEKGFVRDRDREKDTKITADGNAVKNVYYTRKTVTMKFYMVTNSIVELKPNMTITAKYGANIYEQWMANLDYKEPTAGNSRWNLNFWMEGYEGGKWIQPVYTLYSNMPADDKDLYGAKNSPTKAPNLVTYAIETLSGSYETYAQAYTTGGNLGGADKQAPIKGFNTPRLEGNTYYYPRASFDVVFQNCLGVPAETIKFEDNLSKAIPEALPQKPAGVDNDYTFAGWYTTPACEAGTEVHWDTDKMPSNKLVLYAKWAAPIKEITYETNGAGELPKTLVEKYQSIKDKMPAAPTKDGYEFAGWYEDPELKIPFVNSRLITDYMTLYAKWSKVDAYEYTVICRDEKGKEIADPTTGTAKKGDNVTVEAPSIDGYMPKTVSQNLLVDKEGLEVIFTYTQAKTWNYTVKYLDKTTKEAIPGYKAETIKTSNAIETVTYKAIPGYTLDESSKYQQQIKDAGADKENTVIFYYNSGMANYVVKHRFEQADGSYTEASDPAVSAKVGTTVTAVPRAYDESLYTCTTTGKALRGTVTGDGSLVIEITYQRKTANFSVQYYLQNKATGGYELKEAETVTSEEIIGREVSAETEAFAKTFAGYAYDSGNPLNEKTKSVAAAGTTTLKRYYKLNLTVIYDPGDHGTFAKQTVKNLSWGDNTPGFKGELTGESGYEFVAWSPQQSVQVKDSVTYTALWEKSQYKVTATVHNGTIKETGKNTEVYMVDKTPGEITISYQPDSGYKFDRVELTLRSNPKVYRGDSYSESFSITQLSCDAKVDVYFVRDTSDFAVVGYNKEYDGENHSITVNGFVDKKAGETLRYTVVKDGTEEEAVTENPTRKNVCDVKVKVELLDKNKNVLNTKEAPLVITKRKLTINPTKNYYAKVYNTEDPEFKAAIAEETKPVDKELGKISAVRKGVGDSEYEQVKYYENAVKAAVENKDAAAQNFDITYGTAAFEILKAEAPKGAKLTATGDRWTFDGEKHKAKVELTGAPEDADYEIQYWVEDSQSWTTEAPSVRNVSEGEKQVKVRAFSTKYATIYAAQDAYISIKAKDVRYNVEDKTVPFGTTDYAFSGEPKKEDLVAGEELGTIQYSRLHPEQTAVGDYPEEINAKQTPETANSNYNLVVSKGTLHITTATVSGAAVTASGGTHQYDGNSFPATAALSSEAEAAGYIIEYKTADSDWTTEVPSVTNVSDGTKTVSVRAVKEGNETLTTADVSIAITAKPVNVTVTPAQKEFGQVDPKFAGKVDESALVGQDKLDIEYYRTNTSVEDLGTYTDVLSAKQKEAAKNTNYELQVTPATFIIYAKTVKDASVTATGDTWVFDGSTRSVKAELSKAASDAKYQTQFKLQGDTKWQDTAPTLQEVADGPLNVEVRAVVKTAEGAVDQNYVIIEAPQPATLNVTAKAVTYTVDNAEKTYADADDSSTWSGKGSGLVEGFGLSTPTITRKNADKDILPKTYEKVLTAKFTKGADPNYEITVVNGDFTINPAAIAGAVVEAAPQSKVYDGNPLIAAASTTAEGYKILYKTDKDADWSANPPQITNVAESALNVQAKALREGFKDLETVNFTLTVTPKDVRLIANKNNEKYYMTGDPDVKVTAAGLVKAEDLGTYSVTRSDKETLEGEKLGLHENVFVPAYSINNSNYNVELVYGDLNIKTAPIPAGADLTITGDTYTYDGSSHGLKSKELNQKAIEAGYHLEYQSVTPDGTASGWSTTEPTVSQVNEGQVKVYAKAVAYGYEDIQTRTANIQITKRPIEFTVEDAHKDFGQPDPAEFKGSITSADKLVAPGDLGDYSFYRTNAAVNAVGKYEGVLDANYTSNDNYEVTVVKGTFEIKTATDRQATVRATGGTFTYDKNAHGATAVVESDTTASSAGWTVEYNTTDGLTGWTTDPLTKELSVTAVKEGTKTVYVRAVKEGYYPLKTRSVTINIEAIDAVITAPSYSKTYDGTVDIPTNLICEVTGVLDGDDLRPTYKVADGTSPLPGKYDTAIIVDQYDTQNQNYKVNTVPNELEITTAVAEGAQLTLSGGTHVYDGNQYYVGEAQLANVADPENYSIEYSTDGGKNWSKERPAVKDVKDNIVTVSARATREGFKDITSQEATIQVTPREITLEAADAWKYYDGKEPIFTGKADIEELGLVALDDLGEITYERIKKGEDVKVYEDAIEGKYTKNNSNYNVKIIPGDFEIRTASIANASVVASGDEWIYDGTKHLVNAEVKGATGYTIKYSNDNGISWTTGTPGVTNVKDEFNNVSILVKAEREGYETLYASSPVTLKVTAKAITLKAADAWKYFDDEDPAYEGTVAIKDLGLISKDDLGTISFVRTNKGQEGAEAVGTYPRVIEPKFTPNDNYIVTPENGDFEIKTASVPNAEVTAKGGSWTYDGEAHLAEAKLSKEAKDAGYVIWYRDGETGEWTTEIPDITNVADGPKNIYIEARKEGYETLTIDKPYVTIAVTAKEIEYTVKDAEKIFGGDDPAFTGKAEGLVGEDTIDMVFSREPGEAAGTYEKIITAVQNPENYNPNYQVVVTPGDFTITLAAVEGAGIAAAGGIWEYDGEAHKPTVTLSEAAKDYTVYYSIDDGLTWTEKKPSVKDVKDGIKTVKVKAERDNYTTLTAPDIEISIYAKRITITADPSEKKYGNADPLFTGTVNGLVNETDLGAVTYERTDSNVDAGVYESVIVPSYTPNSNYHPLILLGNFKIIPRDIILTAASDEKQYDGTPLTKDEYETSGDGFALGDGFTSVTVAGSQTIPGESANIISYVLDQNTNGWNYNVKLENGTLKVTDRKEKLQIKVTAGSATIVYDGSSHSVKDFETEGLLEKHTIQGIDVNTSGTQVGNYDVNAEGTAVIRDQNDNDVTKQYEITLIAGKLAIMGQVFYDNNGGSGVTVDLNKYGFGAAITVASGEQAAKDGAVFLGWSSEKTDLVTTKDAELSAKENIVTNIAMGPESMTLYAVWAEDVNGPDGGSDEIPDYDEFRITYDPNGAEGSVTDDNIYPGGYEATAKDNGFTNDGYAFDGWNTSANGSGDSYGEGGKFTVNKDTTLYAQWAEDVIGEGENPEEGDGIPDKYQVVVRYTAVNGTVSLEKTVVTLSDKDGKPSEKGTGKLNRVAEAQAQEGYLQASLIWSPQSPQKGMEITNAMTFTATFSTTPAEPGTTPPGPTTPTTTTTPTTPTAVTPTTIIQIITEPLTALADTIGAAVNGRVEELVPVDNEGVPLANKASTDHKCCILHLLLLLLALTVEIGYTKSMKKRQRRIFELREELADVERKQKEQQDEAHIAS